MTNGVIYQNADAWDVLAKHTFEKAIAQGLLRSEAATKAIVVYEEGVQCAPDSDIYNPDVIVISQLLEDESPLHEEQPKELSSCHDSAESGFSEQLITKLREVCQAACHHNCASDATLLRWVEVVKENGSVEVRLFCEALDY